MASYAEYTWLKAHRRMDGKGKDPRGCGNMVARNLPTALCLSRGPLLGCEELLFRREHLKAIALQSFGAALTRLFGSCASASSSSRMDGSPTSQLPGPRRAQLQAQLESRSLGPWLQLEANPKYEVVQSVFDALSVEPGHWPHCH